MTWGVGSVYGINPYGSGIIFSGSGTNHSGTGMNNSGPAGINPSGCTTHCLEEHLLLLELVRQLLDQHLLLVGHQAQLLLV
jgi:hypothetical protein